MKSSGPGQLPHQESNTNQTCVCYPDDFNPETGLFSRKTIAKRIQRYNQKPELAEAQKQSRFQKSDEVLEQVMRISGTDLEEIMTTSKGPGANPARRFAIWALSNKAGLSHKAVAETLSASQNQVAKLVSRMRKNELNPPVKGWIKRFLAQDK
jgi:transposase